MNSVYKFSVDQYGVFTCEITNNLGNSIYRNQKALEKFRMADNHQYNSSRLNKHSIVLSNNSIDFCIENYNEFYRRGLMSYLPNHMEGITAAIRRYKQAQYKKKKLNQLKQAVVKVVVSASIVAMLGVGYNAITATEKPEELIDDKPGYEMMVDAEEPQKEDTIIYAPSMEQEAQENVKEETTSIEDVHVMETTSVQYSSPVEKEPQNVTYLDYEHNRDTEKGDYAYDNYYEIVEKYASKWGISPNMIMSMLTQESGGYHKNLMQIQFWSWEDQVIKVYNFEAGKYENVVLTNNPSAYKQKYGNNIITITESDLNHPITNISIGSVLLRESARMMNNHIGASIQCYNFGYSNMMTVLKQTAKENGVEVKDLLNDQQNIDFVRNTNMISVGDPNYLANVMQYTNNLEEGFVLKEIDENGNIIENVVTILPTSNMKR